MALTIAELNPYLAEAQAGDGVVTDKEMVLFPYYDLRERKSYLSAAVRARVTTPSGQHTVLLSYQDRSGETEINMWCGDRYSEGRVDDAEATTRCTEAATGLPGAAKFAAELKTSTYNKFPDSTGCNFWTLWKKDKSICKHLSSFLHHLKTNNPNFVDELQTLYESKAKGSTGAPVRTSDTYELTDLAFRVPVLYEGDRGAGKTHLARAFARTNSLPCIECPGHEGIEAPDLLGFLVPYGAQQMVWKDGPVSEAFRKARQGKTMLILDEILRIPTRELSILLTAFSPDEGKYRLRTGRIVSVEDGVATEEVLECPVENLCVVATTNVGAEYAVDDIDPALAERFVVIRKDTTTAELKRILSQVAKARGISATEVPKAMAFYAKMVEALARGLVHNIPTTRTMCRAFELATNDEDVVRGLRSQFLLWVARTSEGRPVKEQLTAIEAILHGVFK